MDWLRKGRLLQVIITLAILLMAGFFGVQGLRIQSKLAELRSAPHDNIQWTLAQVEFELQVLQNAITIASFQSETTADIDQVKTRFDILYSRVSVIKNGQVFQSLKAQPGFLASVDKIFAGLEKAALLIDGPTDALHRNLNRLGQAISSLDADARKIALLGVDTFAKKYDNQRAELVSLLNGTAQTGALLLLAMMTTLVFMMRQRGVARQRSKAATESRRRYASTIDVSLDAIIVADSAGTVLEFNPAAEKTFGYSSARAVGSDMSDLIIPESMREAHRKGMERFCQTGERRVVGAGRVELEAINSDGHRFPIELSIGAAEGADGAPILIFYIRDISERKRIENELKHARDRALDADQAKSQFLAVASHEMRTPLNGVMGVLDILSRTKLDKAQRDYLETAVTSGEILQHHIDSVLDITRIEAGAIELEPHTFKMSDLLNEVRKSYLVTAQIKLNTIKFSVPDEIDMVTLDRNRLRQILLNVVGNALKFTEYGLIEIEVSTAERKKATREFLISVRDTGAGIAQENLERIFDDFVTLDASYGRKANGYGMGLSICRRIATAMGGNISLESEVGKGSTFSIVLPEAAVGSAEKDHTHMSDTATEDFNLDVLLVEDNETNRLVASAMLAQFGCRTVEAVDGEDGVIKAVRGGFDLILMDLSMPKIDGLEAVQRLREQEIVAEDLPIVFLTAHAMKDEKDRMEALGVQHVLMKPLRIRNLTSLLQQLFPKHAALRNSSTAQGPDDETEAVIDFSLINELKEIMEPQEIVSAVEKYCNELRNGIREIEALLSVDNLDGAYNVAHRVGGSSAMFGSAALAEALRHVQELARQGEQDAITDLIPDIQEMSESAAAVLRKAASSI